LQLTAHACSVRLEVLKELGAALVLVDAAHVDRKRSVDAELLPEPVRIGRLWHVRADADDRTAEIISARGVADHGALFERIEHDRPGGAKHRWKQTQPD